MTKLKSDILKALQCVPMSIDILVEISDILDAYTDKESANSKQNCDWCGKGCKLVVKHYHKKCHEAILNGEGASKPA